MKVHIAFMAFNASTSENSILTLVGPQDDDCSMNPYVAMDAQLLEHNLPCVEIDDDVILRDDKALHRYLNEEMKKMFGTTMCLVEDAKVVYMTLWREMLVIVSKSSGSLRIISESRPEPWIRKFNDERKVAHAPAVSRFNVMVFLVLLLCAVTFQHTQLFGALMCMQAVYNTGLILRKRGDTCSAALSLQWVALTDFDHLDLSATLLRIIYTERHHMTQAFEALSRQLKNA